MTPLEAFAAQPAGLKVWLLWLFSINAVSIVFVRRHEARWVLAAMVLNVFSMALLMRLYGGGHHMSLPHVVLWTPLLAYIAMCSSAIAKQPRIYVVWAVLLSLSDAASLVLDYISLLHWVLA